MKGKFNLLPLTLGISAIIFLAKINNFPLRNWDEAWYAEIIKNMASGRYSFLVPFWNGSYYFDKPPLYFWLTLPFFKIFGPGEWQARIVAASAAILATFLVYLIGQRIFNQRVAFLSVIIFLTLGQVVIRFAHGNLDALAIFLILATVYFYLAFKKSLAIFLSGVSLAGTYLAKGWVLGLLPILAIGGLEYFLKERNYKRILLTIGLSIVLVAPYYIAGYLKFGKEFIEWYLLTPTANLFSLSAFSLEFFSNLARDVGFWFGPLVWGLVLAAKIKRDDSVKLLVLGFPSLIFLGAISFLSGKIGWYALPVYPLVSAIIAYFSEKVFAKKFVTAGVLVAVVAILQIYNVNRIENIYPDRSKVTAELGKAAAKIVKSEDLLVLDDHDLPAFLYYSGHGTVYELADTDAGLRQWWVLRYDQLPNFISSAKSAWIVTRNPNIVTNAHVATEVAGYKFLKIVNN